MRGSNLLLTFDHDFYIAGQRPVRGIECFDAFDVQVHLTFVVGRTACIHATVAHDGLKGGRRPEVERIDGLNVVMTENKTVGAFLPARRSSAYTTGWPGVGI